MADRKVSELGLQRVTPSAHMALLIGIAERMSLKHTKKRENPVPGPGVFFTVTDFGCQGHYLPSF